MEEQVIVQGRLAILREEGLDWVLEHKKQLLYGVVSVIALLFLFFQLTSKWQGKSQVDYFKAHSSFQQWILSPEGKAEFFDTLKNAIDKHPELHPKYDGLIAERFLAEGKLDQAKPFAVRTFQRVKNNCPYHSRFAGTSIKIAEGRCEEALTEAKELKTDLEGDARFWSSEESLVGFGRILYSYNLLRIAMLEGKAGTAQSELAAWNEFEEKTGEGSKFCDKESTALLMQNFQSQSVSLKDFIAQRKTVLF
jgi:hypothetical protein